MRAAYYEENGPARSVLKIGERPMPEPGPGEVRVQVKVSGVNPSDVKGRRGSGRAPSFPLTIPHSDGAGIIDAVGTGVDPARIGERVLAVEWPVASPVRHRGRVCGAAGQAGGAAAGRRAI